MQNSLSTFLKSSIVIFLIIFHFILFDNLFSQCSHPNFIDAYKIDKPIKLDGILDEKCWDKATKVKNFTQREQNEGDPSTERTEVAIVYTNEILYIGVWCYESEPDKLVAKLMKRDFSYWTEDNFEVLFDTFDDDRNGYIFVINPNGARADVLITNDGGGFNMDWNGIWDTQVINNEKGWFAEIEIPFSTLKFPDIVEHTWGVNFERNIRRKKEAAFWQGWSRNWDFESVSEAGILQGLKNITGKEDLELKPYITSGISLNRDNNTDYKFKLGGDLNYLISPTLKLNITANTDFAQVESDQMQLNLTRFSLYYPEKREFFLEGKDFFEFNLSSNSRIFYSRRIGINNGMEIPILAGARLVGKQGSTNIGALTIQTQNNESIESANYSVVRIKQDVFEKSSVGMIVTGLNQGSNYNYVYGADALYSTSKFLGNNSFSVYGNIANSISINDSIHKNLAYSFGIAYPNDVFSSEIYFAQIQEGFNADMGYLRRKNYKQHSGYIRLRTRPDFLPFIHSIDFLPLSYDFFWTDNTNELETFWLQITPFVMNLKSGDYFKFYIERNFERIDYEFRLFNEIIIPKGKYWFNTYNFGLGTFEGRNYYIYAEYKFGDYFNSKTQSFYTELRMNLGKHINISSSFNGVDMKNENNHVFAKEIGSRFEYAFNPKLNTSLYGQWNNDRKEILLNFRLHWIPVIGSDLYLAANQLISTNNNKILLLETVILAKFVWRFAI